MLELTGKTALVTGGAKRIGKAIAVGLAKQGANIIVHYGKSENEASELRDEILSTSFQSTSPLMYFLASSFIISQTCLNDVTLLPKRIFAETSEDHFCLRTILLQL